MKSKLIRSKLPDIIRAKGEEIVTSEVQDDVVHWELLMEKLAEETLELNDAKTRSDRIEELADVIEVTVSLKAVLETEEQGAVSKKVLEKRETRGGFGRTVLHEKAIASPKKEPQKTIQELYRNYYALRALIVWRNSCTDAFGDDLIPSIQSPLVDDDNTKFVPDHHQAALKEFRALSEKEQCRLIKFVLNDLKAAAEKRYCAELVDQDYGAIRELIRWAMATKRPVGGNTDDNCALLESVLTTSTDVPAEHGPALQKFRSFPKSRRFQMVRIVYGLG